MKTIFVLLLLCFAASCIEPPDCLLTSTNFVKINLKKQDNTANPLAITSIAVPGTVLTFYPNETVSFVTLPVNPESNETTFVFNYVIEENSVKVNKSASLTVGYKNEIRLISEECGAYQYQQDLTILSTDFTNTKLINTSLLIAVPSNLEIYF